MPKIAFNHTNKSVEAGQEEWLYDVVDRAEGGIQMIEDCKSRLLAKGFPESAIHHETFIDSRK
jgi:hypothetical protein